MNNSFKLGLCMAGAVSAGAYTAGVIDFLIEALEEWEKHRGQENVPNHRVEIPVAGGASAGGMTAIVLASAINNSITHIKNIGQGNILEEQPGNKFYHSWVDLVQDDMFPMLLNTEDIGKGKIYSLLNSDFIDRISYRVISVENEKVQRPYIDDHMKIFTTLTNLNGLNYNINFKANITEGEYYLSRHNDYAAFELNKSENEYAGDGWIPLDFFTGDNVEIARNAAMATGAFPAGLKSRSVLRKSKYVNDLAWHSDITKDFPVPGENYESLIVDGGVINNEPFQRVRETLCNSTNEDPNNTGDHNSFKSTVLMVDPFPSEFEQFEAGDELFDVIGSTLSAMMGHLRTKPLDLENALLKDNYNQFLIAPTRTIGTSRVEGSRAIACGSLGGFGGFLHKEFRIHDFFLGRANCERFLREHFTVPIDTNNPIFKEGYRDVNKEDYSSSDNKHLQIIPLFSEQAGEMYMPQFSNGSNWPVRKPEDFERFKKQIKKRAGAMIMNLANYSWFQKSLLWIGNKAFIKRKLADFILKKITTSMKDHKLLN